MKKEFNFHSSFEEREHKRKKAHDSNSPSTMSKVIADLQKIGYSKRDDTLQNSYSKENSQIVVTLRPATRDASGADLAISEYGYYNAVALPDDIIDVLESHNWKLSPSHLERTGQQQISLPNDSVAFDKLKADLIQLGWEPMSDAGINARFGMSVRFTEADTLRDSQYRYNNKRYKVSPSWRLILSVDRHKGEVSLAANGRETSDYDPRYYPPRLISGYADFLSAELAVLDKSGYTLSARQVKNTNQNTEDWFDRPDDTRHLYM